MENLVKQFNEKYMEPLQPNIRIQDIMSEIGELAKEVVKIQDYENKNFEINDDLILEYGDALYTLLSFELENNIDIDLVIKKIIDKYKSRFY